MSVLYYPLLGVVTIETGVNDDIVFTEGAANLTATLAAGDYFLLPPGVSASLLDAITTALDAAGALDPYAATLAFDVDAASPSAVVTITPNSSTANLRLAHISTTFDPTTIGFRPLDTGLAATLSSTRSPTSAWLSDEAPEADDPAFPASSVQLRMMDGSVRTFDRAGPFDDRRLRCGYVAPARSLREEAGSDPAASWEAFWRVHRDGRQLQVHRVAVSSGTALTALSASTLWQTATLDEDTALGLSPARREPGVQLYSWPVGLRGYVA